MRRTAILLLALALGACASGSDGSSGTPTPSGERFAETVYYLQSFDGRWFVTPEDHQVTAAGPGDVLRAAIQEAATGTPQDPDLSSAYPADAEVLTVIDDADGVTVDWNAAVLEAAVDETTALLGIQQVLWTARALAGDADVRFTVEGRTVGAASNGRDIEAFWEHIAINDPSAFRMLDDVEAPITITEPVEGASIAPGSIRFTGDATVFEATVGLRVLDAAGDVIHETFTTAREGAPGRGPWSKRIALDEPGTYVVEAFESSGEDGSDVFVQSRTVVVA